MSITVYGGADDPIETEALIAALQACPTPVQARDLAVTFTLPQIRALFDHFGLQCSTSWASMLERIIMSACGTDFRITVDQWRLVHV